MPMPELDTNFTPMRARGFTKVRVDGQLRSLDEDIKLDRRRNHTIDVVVDRLILKPGIERRLAEVMWAFAATALAKIAQAERTSIPSRFEIAPISAARTPSAGLRPRQRKTVPFA